MLDFRHQIFVFILLPCVMDNVRITIGEVAEDVGTPFGSDQVIFLGYFEPEACGNKVCFESAEFRPKTTMSGQSQVKVKVCFLITRKKLSLISYDVCHIFDGQGEQYWDGHGDWGIPKPNFFTIQTFGGSIIRNISVINSPHDLVQVTNSDNATYTNWYFNNTAGDPSLRPQGKAGKNTDAFDVWNSTNILISNSVVYNQDDCVALRCGSNITVRNLKCHGSHGLSISVGFSNDSTPVNPLNTLTNVLFANTSLFGGENGIHIKTHYLGGFGLIENVIYENISLTGALNYGMPIEQNYPNNGTLRNNVPIKNLTMNNIYGDVEPEATAIYVLCADDGCQNWNWQDVSIVGSKKNNSCNYEFFGSSVCNNNN